MLHVYYFCFCFAPLWFGIIFGLQFVWSIFHWSFFRIIRRPKDEKEAMAHAGVFHDPSYQLLCEGCM